MFEYEFVRIKLKTSWTSKKPAEDYQEIIADYAAAGWRLVQIFAPPVGTYGMADYFELIFERPKDKVSRF